MKIFKELKKLGYKHYTEHTVEELDDLPLDSEERIMEQALVLRWFRDKHGLGHMISGIGCETFLVYLINKNGIITIANANTYEEAELACLNKLIEIVKDGRKSNQEINADKT